LRGLRCLQSYHLHHAVLFSDGTFVTLAAVKIDPRGDAIWCRFACQYYSVQPNTADVRHRSQPLAERATGLVCFDLPSQCIL